MKGKKLFLTMIIIILLNNIVICQTRNISFDRVSGLSQSTAGYIIQGQRGFIWIATFGGLNRYDGYEFKYFQHDDNDSSSLSHDGIVFLFEDDEGYIWVINNSSNAGLDRFDPETEHFLNFRHNPNDPSSISSNTIYHIMQDKKGDLWICTDNALNRVVKSKKGDKTVLTFERFYIPEGQIDFRMAYEDKNGQLLIFGPTLYYFDRDKKTFLNTGLALDMIVATSVIEDQRGTLHIGTFQNGIRSIQYNESKLRYEFAEYAIFDQFFDNRTFVTTDKNQNIWIGSNTKGLFRYNQEDGRLDHYPNIESDQHSMSENSVTSLLVDRSGVLFIGTFSKGICKADLFEKKFLQYTSTPGDPNTLSGDLISSISGIHPNDIWVGVQKDGGVSRIIFDEEEKVRKVIHYHHDPSNTATIGGDFVFCLTQCKNGDVWLGSSGGTISRIIPGKSEYGVGDVIERHIFYGWTFTLYEDSDGALWGGTWGDGIWKYDLSTKELVNYRHSPDDSLSLIDNIIWAINEDDKGNLWIGGNERGISILPAKEKNKDKPNFINISVSKGRLNGLSDNTINAIYQDNGGTIWIGTNNGLNRVLENNGLINANLRFISYTTRDGLPNNAIHGILEDEKGNLWLSTSNGISMFDLSDSTFSNYFESDGLQSNDFWHNSYFKNSNGRMFFGGQKGFVGFYPDEIKANPFIPDVVFTELKIWNKEVHIDQKINKETILTRSINDVSEITLSHNNNVFTITFASLHYAQPEKNKYAYFLQGFDSDWNYTEDQRSATYTNLDPGTYLFKVKGSNNNGIWNETGRTLTIHILPPWWGTWWFRVIFIFTIIGMVFLIFYVRTKNLLHQKLALERKVEARTFQLNKLIQELQEKQDEVETTNEELTATLEDLFLQKSHVEDINEELRKTQKELKDMNAKLDQRVHERTSKLVKANQELDRFVYSASHDLSAPLKSIIGLINIAFLENKKIDLTNHLKHMEKSVYKLENVIKSLTEYSRNSGHEIRKVKFLFDELINEVLDEIIDHNHKNAVNVIKDYKSDYIVESDYLRIKIILSNLISNAIKYAKSENSNIQIKISSKKEDQRTTISVWDNGMGIDPEFIEKIFQMFYRASDQSNGSGLGLYIVKETVEKLKGEIKVDSKQGEYTEVHISFPE